jgi:hypothetical protein
MANISLTPYTNSFFGSFLKSPTQMGSHSINNSVRNISRLGTFKHTKMRRLWILLSQPEKFSFYFTLWPKFLLAGNTAGVILMISWSQRSQTEWQWPFVQSVHLSPFCGGGISASCPWGGGGGEGASVHVT